ncbi:oligosaccharide flippase family protein [Limnohabitans sp.]
MSQNRFQLLKNYISISIVNLINLVAPLVIIPWLIHKLGLSAYGVIAFHQYFGQFVLVLVDFGFPMYAVSEVASRRNNNDDLTRFLWGAYIIKLGLAVIAIIAAATIIASDQASQALGISSVLLAGFVANAILTSLYPGWFFQGIERIQEMILPTFLSRLLSLGIIVAFVREPQDLWIVPTAYCIGTVALLITAYSPVRNYITRTSKPTRQEIQRIGKEALQVFWSRLIMVGYGAASPVLVKMAAGDAGVAIYSLCEKAVSLGRMPFDMFANAAYPRLARGYDKSFAQRLIKKQVVFAGIAVFTLLSSAWALRHQIDPQWADSLKYLSIYLIALIPIAMHSFIGTCVLLVNGQRMLLSTSIIFGLFAYLATFAMGGWIFENQVLRVIISMVMVEFGIMFVRYFFSRRLKLI